MRRNWIVSLFACLVLVLGLAAAAAEAQDRKIVMRIGCIATPPQPQSMAAEEFKRLVEARVGDRLDVQVYHSLQLGTIAQHLQGLQNGSIHGIFFPNGFYGPVVPEVMILDLGFFFPDSEWVYQMFNKGYTKPLDDAMQLRGLVFVSTPPAMDRRIFVSKELKSLNDFSGVRIRTYSSPINQRAISLMGFTPANIDSAEMPVAIQQGTVDGVECDITFWYAMKLFKANNMIDFYHETAVHMMNLSKRWFDPLPEDIKQAIIEAGRATPALVHDYIQSTLISRIENDPAARLNVLKFSEADIKAIKERSMPVHDMYKNEGPTFQATYDYYKDLLERYPNPADAPNLLK